MTSSKKALIAPLGALCVALGVAACGETSSTGSYKGDSQHVANTISNLQSDATASNASKICSRDLAQNIVKRLQESGGSCKQALESQLREIDTYSLAVESISVKGDTATAKVKSTWSGTQRVHTLSFVKESGSWKISGLS
jgi:ABC-type oligopeptide transport system substrate-binding subunit